MCGSNLSLVNRNERGVMQISKSREQRERERWGFPGRMDKTLCHVCVFGNVYCNVGFLNMNYMTGCSGLRCYIPPKYLHFMLLRDIYSHVVLFILMFYFILAYFYLFISLFVFYFF